MYRTRLTADQVLKATYDDQRIMLNHPEGHQATTSFTIENLVAKVLLSP